MRLRFLHRTGQLLLVISWVIGGLGCTFGPGPTGPPIVLLHENREGSSVPLDAGVSVLMVGGHHEMGRDEEFLARWLPELVPLGYRTLALEIPRSYQSLVDAYLDGQGRVSTTLLFQMIFQEDFPKLLDVAARLDMRVLCYESMETFAPWAPLSRRDRISFETICREGIGTDPQGKVVVFCGALHLRDGIWYSHLLERPERCLGHYMAEFFGPELVRVDLSRLSGR